jgi:hypothetical protein
LEKTEDTLSVPFLDVKVARRDGMSILLGVRPWYVP